MALETFLSNLFADGRVRVSVEDPLLADMDCIDTQLLAAEQRHRDDLPGTPPAISLEAARFGANLLYRACQYVVYREVEPDMIRKHLGVKLKAPDIPATHYSVDLTLRFLPDVVRLARAESAEDPLVVALLRVAGQWPLSAVGIDVAASANLTAITQDSCLLQLYVDRILARHDYARLSHPQVRDVAKRALGAFPELDPKAAVVLGIDTRESVCEEHFE
jgi:hypothetical protein